jgi:hypothetical protein
VGLALDAATPAAVQSLVALTVTTGSFTIPAGSLLIANFAYDTANQVDGATITITDNTGAALSWQTISQAGNSHNNPGLSTSGGVYAARAYSAAGRTLTVTGTKTGNPTAGCWMRVLVITGADSASPIGNINATTDNTGTFSQSVTTTRANSWVWCAVCDWDTGAVPTPGTGCSLDSGNVVGALITCSVLRRTSIQPVSGTAEIVSNTAPTSVNWNLVAYEIKEAVVDSPIYIAPGFPPGFMGPWADRGPNFQTWDPGISSESFTHSTLDSVNIHDGLLGSKVTSDDITELSHANEMIPGFKIATGSTRDEIRQIDIPTSIQVRTGAVVDSARVTDVTVVNKVGLTSIVENSTTREQVTGSKFTVRPLNDFGNTVDFLVGNKLSTRSLLEFALSSDRPLGLKIAVKVGVESVTLSDRSLGFKSTNQSIIDLTRQTEIQVGTKLAVGLTRSSATFQSRPSSIELRVGSVFSYAHVLETLVGNKISAKSLTDSNLIVTRPAGKKIGLGLNQDFIAPGTISIGKKIITQSSFISIHELQELTGIKFGSGNTFDKLVAEWISAVEILASNVKIWSGTEWVACPVNIWNGTEWEPHPLKTWSGTEWV